jgi:hypothetical protein
MAEASPELIVASFTLVSAALLAAARIAYQRLALPCLEKKRRRENAQAAQGEAGRRA